MLGPVSKKIKRKIREKNRENGDMGENGGARTVRAKGGLGSGESERGRADECDRCNIKEI